MHGLPLCLLTDVVCCGGGMKQLYITTLKREYMKTNTRKLYLLESVWIRVVFNIRDVNILER
jgi:hypothetical protein